MQLTLKTKNKRETTITCCICRRPRKLAWSLGGYYGIGSQFDGRGKATVYEPCCKQCFESIAHDGLGKPRHPKRYAKAIRRYMR